MLSLRYAVRQVPIELVSSMRALQLVQDEDGISGLKVRFSADDVPGIPVIVKRNTMLFQALESIHAEEKHGSRPESSPSDEVITDFLDDLAVVIWPPRVDKMIFMDSGNVSSLSGKELRRMMFGEGFDLGKAHMVPLLAGAGMSRSGKYLFIRDELREEALSRITLGLVGTDAENGSRLSLRETHADRHGKAKNVTVNPAKLLAYIGLADTDGVSLAELDAIRQTRSSEPRQADADSITIDSGSVIVVKDVYKPLKINAIGEYVICNDNGNGGEVTLRKLRDDENACLTDGYGFICPEWSAEINRLRRCRDSETCEEASEGFQSRAFIIRLPFVKGAVIECDYVRYLQALDVQKITDMWGETHPLVGVKMILTESMFKGAKLFPHMLGRKKGQRVWDFYCEKLKASGLSMILAGSDSAPTQRTSLNYQFLSSMQPDEKDLEKLTAWELARQKNRLALLKVPEQDENGSRTEDAILKFAENVIRHLEESVRVEAEKQTEQANEDAPAEVADADGAPDPSARADAAPQTDAEPAAARQNSDASYAELLARLLRKYPHAALTRTVMEELAAVTVKAASDASQGRIRVRGDVRILCGDPFILLNSIAESAGVHVSPQMLPLLQCEGMVYAPGLKDRDLLLLRNPHVSAFEAIVAKNLDAKAEGARDKYHAWFGQHHGVIFVNSAVASTLGGADFDGDRAKVILEPSAIDLVKSNTKKINALLKASGDDSFKLDRDANVEGKALPIVSIQGFPANNLTVTDMNRSYWDNVFKTHLQSIESKVGLYSVNGATLAFNHGMVAAANPSDAEQRMQAVALLKTMARLTTVIGLDIDAAKSGARPSEPKYGKMGRMPALLRFSRSFKKTSPHETVLHRYQSAYNSAKWSPAPDSESVSEKIQRYDSLKGTIAASDLVDSFRLDGHYGDLQHWLPASRGMKWQKNEKSFIDVLCGKLAGAPDAAMSAALKELQTSTALVDDSRAAAGEITRFTDWILKRRVDILQHLLRYYPLETALSLDRRILKGAEDPVKKISLDSDSALIGFAFCTNETRETALKETIFGAQADKDFIYDVTALQLAKHVQRLRNALASKKKLLEKESRPVFVPVSYDRQRAEIKGVAAKHNVDCWELGLWMMKRGVIREKDFVLLFVADMKDSAGKEVGAHDQPQSGGH